MLDFVFHASSPLSVSHLSTGATETLSRSASVTILVGTITPPVGVQLFIAADIAKVSVFRVEVWPFVGLMMFAILLMMLFPQIVTIVPELMM